MEKTGKIFQKQNTNKQAGEFSNWILVVKQMNMSIQALFPNAILKEKIMDIIAPSKITCPIKTFYTLF